MEEMKLKGSERVYHIIAYILVALFALLTLIPVLLIVVASFTDETTLVTNGYSFIPSKFSLDSYLYMKNQLSTILRAYGISIASTSLGTVIALIVTSMIAYPLSRRDFKFRKTVMVNYPYSIRRDNTNSALREQYCMTNGVDAIIEESVFDTVQEEKKKRSTFSETDEGRTRRVTKYSSKQSV